MQYLLNRHAGKNRMIPAESVELAFTVIIMPFFSCRTYLRRKVYTEED